MADFVTVSATLASTNPVSKYPGWQLSKEALERMAQKLNAGAIPMLFDHDATRVIEVRNVQAQVVEADDGEFVLKATFDAPASDWQALEHEFDSAGVPGGFSFTASTPQTPSASGSAAVTLAADAAAWTDTDRDAARAILDAVAPTESARLFQYGVTEVATVIVVLAQTVAIPLLVNALYDAVKGLIRKHPGSTRLEVHRTNADGSVVKAIVTTDDPEVAKAAISTITADQRAPVVLYDAEQDAWLDPASPTA